MARVVVLGSSNTDLTVRLPRMPAAGETLLGGAFAQGPGGKGANQAVAARRAGADVTFLTAVGDDPFGRASLERYQAEGIDVSHARVVPGVASGVALIFVSEQGENMIGVAPGANAQLTPADIDALPESVFDPSAVLLASLEVPLETVKRALERGRAAGMITVLNPAPADQRLAAEVEHDDEGDVGSRGSLFALVDLLTPNHSEAATLAGFAIETAGEAWSALEDLQTVYGMPHMVITRGAEGCVLVGNEDPMRIHPFEVEVVDTVGAGDAFNGALAVALAENRPLLDAIVWANAAGALAVTRPGAQGASPRRADIDRLAAQARPPEPFFPR